MKIPTIQPDKLTHYFWGSVAALIGLLAGVLGAAVLCAAVAIGREVYNERTGGTFDPSDILATVLGGSVVVAAWVLGRV
jgi:hypothetical protein